MLRRLGIFALAALTLAAPALFAQTAPAATKAAKPAISPAPWPEDDVLLARRTDAQRRPLFQDGPRVEFTLTAPFNLINRERTPNNAKRFPGVLTIGGADLAVRLGSRGHLRLKSQTCDFVPIRIDFRSADVAGTSFEGQDALKLGTHCRSESEFDQYVVREYLSYKLANLVTPLSFRARLARATYIEGASRKVLSTRAALFLEHENDVARRLGAREVRQPHMVFKDFDRDALTTTMMLEYMLGNTDYSIWALHNVVIVQDKKRTLFPVAYDFDMSGMVHPPYAIPDTRLRLRAVTDRLYRGPCRTVDEINGVAEQFRSKKADMIGAVESMKELSGSHRGEMKDYLESFFKTIDKPESIKKAFVDGYKCQETM